MNTSKKTLVWLFMTLAALASVMPFIWMLITSLKTQAESIQIPPTLLPQQASLLAYGRIMREIPFVDFYINSLLATFFTVTLQMVIATMAAYGFSRLHFRGRDLLFMLCVSILMVPSQAFLIPQFLVIQKMGLVNTITGLVLPGIFSIYVTFLLRQFFLAVPKEMEEAALIDGYSHFAIFWRIMLPLIRPGIIACIIINGLWSWNNLMWPLIVNTTAEKLTLPVGLASLSSRAGVEYPLLMAGALMAVIPMLMLFILFQRYFIQGIASAGVKG
ncbi:carbohydrate ABC transporter permease [Affinibrenneria salicis]|uniref:Carbohydrate ABC transporter permease n=1 Tax=Affinibrenneria salicis TaxID=2590031 RepID=A0A5J5FWP3_9GAMM|nr:carbohydrate ABC transporter permease [Affinibrenneria salicis]KAA8998086.1 carbohydrate ABC transporter permease [Affinibrenneria salicis]